ncbi:MAG: hypothetical protein Q7T78_04605 [Rhodoferax sp.]|nr:hypothetical protein [Rhodoferax sp.]
MAGLHLPNHFPVIPKSIQNKVKRGGIGLGVDPTIQATIPPNVPPLDGDEA